MNDTLAGALQDATNAGDENAPVATSHSKEPLTRAQMEAVIRDGGSVTYQGRHIANVAHLPSEADMAKGDPAKEGEVADKLQRQIDEMQAQLASLRVNAEADKSAAKADADAKAKADADAKNGK